jgi:hypothetical protein
MTDINANDVIAELNVARILVAIVEDAGEISVPVSSFITAVNEDKELQVDYDKDSQTFTFKLKSKEIENE